MGASGPRGLIFDIQGFSVHDGPGSRTTVFLSGCPLRCLWCANPEGQEPRQRLLFAPQKCRNGETGCVRCAAACPHGALTAVGGQVRRREAVCAECRTFDCARACYAEALRLSGKWYAVEELMAVLRRDRQYWENGGVTFSGGDPLAQEDFLLAVLDQCRREGIHTALETSGHAPMETFLAAMARVDFAFVDVKHMDTDRHRERTGVGNERILENIAALAKSSWPGRLVLRMPVIEDYNDTIANAEKVSRFMKDSGLVELNLLPFHRMGRSKWEQLGMTYPYGEARPTPAEKLRELQRFYLDRRIACYIGDGILY